jgi:hypothetical protein
LIDVYSSKSKSIRLTRANGGSVRRSRRLLQTSLQVEVHIRSVSMALAVQTIQRLEASIDNGVLLQVAAGAAAAAAPPPPQPSRPPLLLLIFPFLLL